MIKVVADAPGQMPQIQNKWFRFMRLGGSDWCNRVVSIHAIARLCSVRSATRSNIFRQFSLGEAAKHLDLTLTKVQTGIADSAKNKSRCRYQ